MFFGGFAGRTGRGGRLAHGQQTIRRHAFVRQDAEEPAGRYAGKVDQGLKMFRRGKSLAQFPGADGGFGNAKFGGELLQWIPAPPPPRAERLRKAHANIAPQGRVAFHNFIMGVSSVVYNPHSA